MAQVLAAGAMIGVLTPVPVTVLQSLERPDVVSKVLAAQIFYPFIVWLAIVHGGIVGAAVAFAIRAILQALIMLWFANRHVRLGGRQRLELWRMLALLFPTMLLSLLLANLEYTVLRVAFWLVIAGFSIGYLARQSESREILGVLSGRTGAGG